MAGCTTKTVPIEPPKLLLLDRACKVEPKTYREALLALEDCATANAGNNADKAAIREFYKGL